MKRRPLALLGTLLLAFGVLADVVRAAAGSEPDRVRVEAAIDELEPAMVGSVGTRSALGVEASLHASGRASRIRLATRTPRNRGADRLAPSRFCPPRRLLRFSPRGVEVSSEPH